MSVGLKDDFQVLFNWGVNFLEMSCYSEFFSYLIRHGLHVTPTKEEFVFMD